MESLSRQRSSILKGSDFLDKNVVTFGPGYEFGLLRHIHKIPIFVVRTRFCSRQRRNATHPTICGVLIRVHRPKRLAGPFRNRFPAATRQLHLRPVRRLSSKQRLQTRICIHRRRMILHPPTRIRSRPDCCAHPAPTYAAWPSTVRDHARYAKCTASSPMIETAAHRETSHPLPTTPHALLARLQAVCHCLRRIALHELEARLLLRQRGSPSRRRTGRSSSRNSLPALTTFPRSVA